MLSFFKDYRIRTKLLLIMLFAGIPVTASIAFLLISEYRTDLRESEHAIQVTTEAIAAQHEAYLNGIHTLLVTVSQFPEVKQRDPERCKQLLQTILKKNPTSLNIGIADIQGNLIASGVNATFSIADRKYFKDALRTKRFSVGEYVISRAVGKPAIHFALPVLTDTGNVSAVIYTTFDLTHFNSIFRAQHLPPNSALNITDHNGVLLHRYPDHAVVKQGILDRQNLRERMTGPRDEGVFNEIGMDKTKRFLAFKRLRLHPDERPYLYIRVSIPESEALANANQHLAIMAGMLAVASLLALWTTHFFSRRFFIKPLERLATVARSAEHEDFSVRSGLDHTRDEIGLVAQAFDTMSSSLERRSREKEHAEQERRILEKQLIHTQKLESLGILAGGIAHDFNNILTVIIGNADLALNCLNENSPAVTNVNNISKAASRAADLAMQMLAYAGKGKFVIEIISLNLLLQEILHMLQVSISKKAKLKLNLASNLPPVNVDATQMRQIIMNLVINASEAISNEGGIITITTGCTNYDESYGDDIWMDEKIAAGQYVYMEVADNGCGMDNDTLTKIFDPFFTTKFTGRGLGMASVLGIVRSHKGAIKINSETGKGSTFRILLPASENNYHSKDWPLSCAVPLVDDEAAIGVGTKVRS